MLRNDPRSTGVAQQTQRNEVNNIDLYIMACFSPFSIHIKDFLKAAAVCHSSSVSVFLGGFPVPFANSPVDINWKEVYKLVVIASLKPAASL